MKVLNITKVAILSLGAVLGASGLSYAQGATATMDISATVLEKQPTVSLALLNQDGFSPLSDQQSVLLAIDGTKSELHFVLKLSSDSTNDFPAVNVTYDLNRQVKGDGAADLDLSKSFVNWTLRSAKNLMAANTAHTTASDFESLIDLTNNIHNSIYSRSYSTSASDHNLALTLDYALANGLAGVDAGTYEVVTLNIKAESQFK